MSKNLNIVKYVAIKNKSIFVDGKKVFTSESDELNEILKDMYKSTGEKYMKFFKMDSLCKLAFIASEYLLQEIETDKKNTALVFSNKASSLDTDRKHQHSIDDRNNYFPSPAVFVYTLANIMLGEICIKHKFQGENCCFIADTFNPKLFNDYVKILFEKGNTNQCIVGWVDVDNNQYDAFMVLVEQNEAKNVTFDTNILLKLYNE